MTRHAGLFAAFLSVISGTGVAQAAAPAGSADGNNTAQTSKDDSLQEIVVTAQRRSESLQKVSLSVTAVTGDTLTEQHVIKPEDLVYLAPDVKLTEAVSPTAKGFAVRGVGTQNFGGVPVAVPVVVDEFILPSYIGFQSLFDVDTVQILKGPQGTLFGADSSAGLMNIVTAKPQLGTWSGKAHVSYQQADSLTDFDTRSLQGVVNIPIGTDAAVRVTGYNTHRSPWFYDPILGRKIEPLNDSGVRAKLLWQPNDNFSAELTGSYSQQNEPFHTNPIVGVVPGGYFQGLLAQYGVTPGPANDTVFVDKEGIGHFWDYYVNDRLSWQFNNGFTLQSITGYIRYRINGIIDADQGPLNLLQSAVGTTDPGNGNNQGWTFSQEFKAISPVGQRFSWVAGALYTDSYALAPGGFPGILTPALAGTPYGFDFRYNIGVKPETYALYGQGTFEFAEGWRLLAGVRGTDEKSTFTYSSFNTPGSLPFVYPVIPFFQQKYDDWNYAWKLGFERDLTPDAMAYLNVARGYKGPGFSLIAVAPGQNTYVKPEIPMQYEIGVKSFLFERRLRLNAAAFVTNFKDYQAQVYDTTPPVPRILTANAGALKTRGLDVEFQARPVSRLSVSGGVAYVFAQFKDLDNQPCYPGQTLATGCAANGLASGSGQNLPNSPRWTGNLQTDYTAPIFSNLNLIAGLDYYWRSAANFSALGDPALAVGSYGLLGAKLGIGAESGKWTLMAYGKNLANKHFVAGLGNNSGLYNSVDTLGLSTYRSPDSYRQVGVSLDVSL
jgi:iron complex outermembrane recepter protein